MALSKKYVRLAKAARELNTGIVDIVSFLQKKGFEVESRPMFRLTLEMYELLKVEFQRNRELKEKARTIKLKSLKTIVDNSKVTNENIIKRRRRRTNLVKSNTFKKESSTKFDIWQANIDAQEIIANQYSEPFEVTYIGEHTYNSLKFQLSPDTPLQNIKPIISKAFPQITDKQIDLKNNNILYNANKAINQNRLKELEKYAAANYFDFSPKPCITGSVELKKNPFKKFSEIIGIDITPSGEALATFKQINAIDNILIGSEILKRNDRIGAIYILNFSEFYFDKQLLSLKKILKEKLSILNFQTFGYKRTVFLDNIFMKPSSLNEIKKHTNYKNTYHKLILEIEPIVFQSFLKTRREKNIFFRDEKEEEEKYAKTFILQNPVNNEFHYNYPDTISLSEFRFEAALKICILSTFFGKENIKVKHQHILKVSREDVFAQVEKLLPKDIFQISDNNSTISFDFSTLEELKLNLEQLNAYKELSIENYEDEHKYKIRFTYNTPLLDVANSLEVIPNVRTRIVNGGSKLLFHYHFQEFDTLPTLRARIVNILEGYDKNSYNIQLDKLNKRDLKYYIYFRQEDYEKDIKKRLYFLIGEDLKIRPKLSIGILSKVDFPNLTITPDIKNLPVHLTVGDKYPVYGLLKGEKDKIKRLKDTLTAIYDTENSTIVNKNLQEILKDSSTAKVEAQNITESQKYLGTLYDVKNNLLSKYINSRQLEAVAKSILSKDIFIIQGPPGTGKSTAISEIIWQHIHTNLNNEKSKYSREGIKKFKILVTSETNLAVDNALDKLRSKHHNLIKPVRFGSDKKLDKEGKRFHIENLSNWVENIPEKQVEGQENTPNILEDWTKQVAEKSARLCQSELSESQHSAFKPYLEKWKNLLSQPQKEVRKQFYDNYLKFCNVIGATCSSIGKYTADPVENGNNLSFTKFFRNYCDVYYPKDKHIKWKLDKRTIEFDLIIQDEASKASPPELALPCIYGKKAIIIGDHKQLPPMIDTKEFIENLEYQLQRTSHSKNKRKIQKLIKYVNGHKEDFSISHFQRLFENISPNLKTTFNLQYRMHPDINDTIKQFYIDEGGLECGLINPKDLGVNDKDLNNFASRYHGINIPNIIDENTHVLWVEVNSPEMRVKTSRVNIGEVVAIEKILNQINQSLGFNNFKSFWGDNEVEEKQIGVITFYGAQATRLNKLKDKFPNLPLRISPVDRFQGMERNIVIVSLVRSNKIAEYENQKPDFDKYPVSGGYQEQKSLGFAEFPNRLNVALSRAKRLLIIVGNAEHFKRHKIYANVYDTIEKHGRIITFENL